MRDPVSLAELDHDREGSRHAAEAEPYLSQALDDLIDRLFSGKKVGLFYLDAYFEKFASEGAARMIASHLFCRYELEELIRADLADSDEVWDRAAELTQAAREEA